MADPAPRRILVVRISALGDIVFATSLLEGLRNAFPEAWIAWLAQPGFAGILEGDPRVSEILRTPPAPIGSFGALRALRRQLRDLEPFDWVLDAQGLFKSRLVARMPKAKQRIGFESKEPGGFFMDRLVEKGGDPADISSEYRHLAQVLTGVDPGPPRLHPSAAARDRVAAALQARGLAPGFVALCPFTTRPQKHW
ncbi:MAG TPA: glycosyltransferase family 9 protein, partial [Nevskiaceae bacterium]|nr:glycosyltransferase family 9 protein [Nevskiaceae bacterium]